MYTYILNLVNKKDGKYMINYCYMEEYKLLSKKLMDKSEFAIIILNNSTDSVSYRMKFIKSKIPEYGGIQLQVKDQHNRDLYTDGFFVDNKVIQWVFKEIEKHLG